VLKEERRGSRLIGMEGSVGEFAFELLEDSITDVGDGFCPRS